MVKVPNLLGLTKTGAITEIQSKNLVPVDDGTVGTADTNLNNKIASQLPAFDVLVDYDSSVAYKYYQFAFTPEYSFTPTTYTFTPTPSGPSYVMPNVVGMTNSAAASAINSAGLNYEFTYYVDNAGGATSSNNGLVASQDPAAGTYAPELASPGSGATLYIYQYTAVTPTYTFTPETPVYTFTPTSPNPTLYYAYCEADGENPNGVSTGLQSTSSYESCSALQTAIQSTGSLLSSWSCNTSSSSVTVPTCGATQQVTYYIGTSTCNVISGYYGSSSTPSASGPYYASSMPSDTTTGPNNARVKTVYRSTYSAALSDAANSACSGTAPTYTFTPYSFTPETPAYTFTPETPAYTFTPETPAYTFTPETPTYTFTPYSFTPITYEFTPLKVCIDGETLVQVVGPNNSIAFKPARDIKLGDMIWSVTWNGLLDDIQDPSASTVYPSVLDGVNRVQSEIVQIQPSYKDRTIYFNGDQGKRFTAEEKVLVKRGDSHIFVEAKTVTLQDRIFEATDYGMSEVPVSSLDYIEETREVFKFNAYPVDTIIAGNMIVHNSKV